VWGSLTSAIELERRSAHVRKRSFWSYRNDLLNAWAMTVVLFGALVLAFGPGVLPFLLAQAVVGFSLLEVVNYLEHYGLLRQRNEAGRYERVDPRHSWNSNNLATNVLLYHLQRHSDHHANPTRRYQALRDHEESPVLPTGYAGMILLALLPSAWRRVMDQRVLTHVDGDVTLTNIAPHRRTELLTRYGAMPASNGPVVDPARDIHGHAGETRAIPGGLCPTAHRCPVCGYTYADAVGDEREGFAPGTAWSQVPDSWCCPDCGVRDKADFVALPAVQR
jgi:alkane 1-monooxygenase